MTTRQMAVDVPKDVLLQYALGRLSSGRAAELAGMSRVEFLISLGRYAVFPLEAELRELERDRG